MSDLEKAEAHQYRRCQLGNPAPLCVFFSLIGFDVAFARVTHHYRKLIVAEACSPSPPRP
jgi:hypothetical protein